MTELIQRSSWKTTVGGILLAIGVPLAAGGEGVYQIIGMVMSSIGGLFTTQARDNNKSSEDVGTKHSVTYKG